MAIVTGETNNKATITAVSQWVSPTHGHTIWTHVSIRPFTLSFSVPHSSTTKREHDCIPTNGLAKTSRVALRNHTQAPRTYLHLESIEGRQVIIGLDETLKGYDNVREGGWEGGR